MEAVIGLGYFVEHDSNVAAFTTTGDVFVCSEERLSRNKRDGSVPYLALALARNFAPGAHVVCASSNLQQYLAVMNGRQEARAAERVGLQEQLLRQLGTTEFLGHHYCHAAGAFLTSGFDEAFVVTYDGGIFTEPWLATIWQGQNGRLKSLRKFTLNDGANIALIYSGVTALLGFKPTHDEGKITGLAAFGVPNAACADAIVSASRVPSQSHKYWLRSFPTAYSWLRACYSDADIAATLQLLTESSVLQLLIDAAPELRGHDCVLAGGLFANVRLNQRIMSLGIRRLYVYPAMGDDGLGLGAIAGYLSSQGIAFPPLNHVYVGPAFAPEQIEEALTKYGCAFRRSECIEDEIAELLARGHTVARFTGAMEFGPRALGNRTILANASDRAINEKLNAALSRTDFMPFAPVTLASHAHYLYNGLEGLERCTPFMTVSVDCTPQMKAQSPAVVHVDGTARPQLVSEGINPSLYRVLQRYHQLTGIPTLINTSFNVHGEPIVCAPDDALSTFFRAGLDYLALDCFLVNGAVE